MNFQKVDKCASNTSPSQPKGPDYIPTRRIALNQHGLGEKTSSALKLPTRHIQTMCKYTRPEGRCLRAVQGIIWSLLINVALETISHLTYMYVYFCGLICYDYIMNFYCIQGMFSHIFRVPSPAAGISAVPIKEV